MGNRNDCLENQFELIASRHVDIDEIVFGVMGSSQVCQGYIFIHEQKGHSEVCSLLSIIPGNPIGKSVLYNRRTPYRNAEANRLRKSKPSVTHY